MVPILFQVALGGAIGSAARYMTGVVVLRAFGSGFPLGVLTVNLIGSFLMGVFVIWAGRSSISHLSPFVMTGLLGGYTTFSAFSLESVTLIERGQIGSAALYLILSIGGAMCALFVGVLLAREIWP